MRRGIEKVKTEWRMVCTVVNLEILLRDWNEPATVLDEVTTNRRETTEDGLRHALLGPRGRRA